MDIKSTVQKYIQQVFLEKGVSQEFSGQKRLISEGYLDSFEILSLIEFIERQFDVHLDSLEITQENFDTLSNLTALIQSKMDRSHS